MSGFRVYLNIKKESLCAHKKGESSNFPLQPVDPSGTIYLHTSIGLSYKTIDFGTKYPARVSKRSFSSLGFSLLGWQSSVLPKPGLLQQSMWGSFVALFHDASKAILQFPEAFGIAQVGEKVVVANTP